MLWQHRGNTFAAYCTEEEGKGKNCDMAWLAGVDGDCTVTKE